MELQISQLKKKYGDRTVVRIDELIIHPGRITAVVGPNGAGKTTLLCMLAGLLEKDEGQILYNGSPVPPYREMTMVFQKPRLLTASVRKNIGWPLKIRGWEKEKRENRVRELAEELGLLPFLEQRADCLSAGEAQKTALARALSFSPRLLLLDEPGANIDPGALGEMESVLTEMNSRHGTTIVLVTHNLAQAKRIAHQVVLLIDGRAAESCDAEKFFTAPDAPETKQFLETETIWKRGERLGK